jgi:hypothetical protein
MQAARLDEAAALDAAREAVSKEESGASAAQKALAAALAHREAIRARIEADDAKFADPPDSKRADILAIAATHAERQAKRMKAEADLAQAEVQLAELHATPGEKAKPARKEAEAREKVDKARKALAEARKTADGPHSTAYTPLIPPRPETSTGRRLALARWMVDRSNPLAARVVVNHVWMRHFGRPLVATVFDFGLNGKRPTHPELLDWLAVELMDSGWSLKHLHRLIVTSRAYRMRSWAPAGDPNAQIDPENLALWRMNPRRMEAELVRDNVLHVAGSLDPRLGGPEIDHNAGLTVPRRSLYFRHAAEKQMTFLKLFDAANMSACYRRDESVMPQQALALANSPLSLGEARKLAGRLAAEVGSDNPEFVAAAFERIMGRPPTGEESSACLAYLAEQASKLAAASALTPFAEGPAAGVPPSADPAQRAREDLVHVLLNHNDFVTIR